MIKNYTLVLMLFITGVIYSQEHISFEVNEGYALGTLNAQNGWEVTDDNEGGFIQNQVVTNEQASDGLYAFKNAYEPDLNPGWLPIFGAVKSFAEPISYEGFSISYDLFITEMNGSNFEFTVFGVDALDEFVPVAGVAMDFEGEIYVFEDIYYGSHYIEGATWTPNTWTTVKIDVSETELKYYLNDVLVYTDSNFSLVDIVGFNMLHDNYGGDAYYDNFIITDNALSMDDFSIVSDFRVFPNPIQDELKIQGENMSQIAQVVIYNLQGQKIIESQHANTLNVSSLSAGVYFLKIDTVDSRTYTHKLVKK